MNQVMNYYMSILRSQETIARFFVWLPIVC